MDISSQLDYLNAHLETIGLKKASLGGECPVECEGVIDDWYLYFRARNNRWRCCIAPTPRGAVGGENPSVEIYGIYGKTTENGEASDKPVDRFGAGYMAYDVAVKIIEAAIVMFRLNIEMKLQEGIDIAGLSDSQNQT